MWCRFDRGIRAPAADVARISFYESVNAVAARRSAAASNGTDGSDSTKASHLDGSMIDPPTGPQPEKLMQYSDTLFAGNDFAIRLISSPTILCGIASVFT
jgi:hypothetical protein